MRHSDTSNIISHRDFAIPFFPCKRYLHAPYLTSTINHWHWVPLKEPAVWVGGIHHKTFDLGCLKLLYVNATFRLVYEHPLAEHGDALTISDSPFPRPPRSHLGQQKRQCNTLLSHKLAEHTEENRCLFTHPADRAALSFIRRCVSGQLISLKPSSFQLNLRS